MRAFVFEDRFSRDALTLVERPQPKPGPGQALVRVRATFLPRPERVAFYRRLFDLFREAEAAVAPLSRQLAAIGTE